jgi:hypothetical protein
MERSSEVDLDLRENVPLSRNTLHTQGEILSETGQQMRLGNRFLCLDYRHWSELPTSTKVEISNLNYLISIWDSAESGLGLTDNHLLNYFAESISMNVGGPLQNVNESSPQMSDVGVGVVIVVGTRENLAHGEGPQFVEISEHINRVSTRMKFL